MKKIYLLLFFFSFQLGVTDIFTEFAHSTLGKWRHQCAPSRGLQTEVCFCGRPQSLQEVNIKRQKSLEATCSAVLWHLLFWLCFQLIALSFEVRWPLKFCWNLQNENRIPKKRTKQDIEHRTNLKVNFFAQNEKWVQKSYNFLLFSPCLNRIVISLIYVEQFFNCTLDLKLLTEWFCH